MYGIKDYVSPVAGKFRVTSGEGNRKARRTTNGAMMSSFHHGVDIAGQTPGSKPDIRNVTAGRVLWAGKAGGYGNTVVVQNPDGYIVQYGHLDSISVRAGDNVSAGQKIGVMGATGNVTGVHLDMIVIKDGKSLRRDGSVLASAPNAILRRAKAKPSSSQSAPSASTSATPSAVTPSPQTTPSASNTTAVATDFLSPTVGTESFSSTPLNLLQGGVGIAIPETQSENRLFGQIADMNLTKGLESIYAEASRAIAGVKDDLESRPMIQSNNPLRAELSSIFDSIDI